MLILVDGGKSRERRGECIEERKRSLALEIEETWGFGN